MMGRYCFHWCLSVYISGGGDTYPGWGGGGVLDGKRGYLPWMGEEVTTLDGGGVPTLNGGEVVHTLDREGVPTLDRGRGTYPTWKVVPTLDTGRGYLSWMGDGVPTLDGERGVSILDRGKGVPNLDWGGGTYPSQVMPWAIRLLRLPTEGLSFFIDFNKSYVASVIAAQTLR